MSLDELVVLLHKVRREVDMIGRRLDIAIVDIAAHRDSKSGPKSRKAPKRKKK
jgi:hypothetical protein